jgi:hypothetical protein
MPHPLLTSPAERIQPAYPSRYETLLGMPAYRGDIAKVEEAMVDPCILLKYPCTLRTAGGMLVEGTVVTYLEIQDWADYKNFSLVSVDGPAELALTSERTCIG